MKHLLYTLLQCTWGVLQTAIGSVVFLIHHRAPHRMFHGAIVTVWRHRSSVSLGMFIFITDDPYFYNKLKDNYTKSDLSARLLVHEYGHTIQSLILGPLYLLVMGIPSTLWGFLPSCANKRRRGVSYFSFFTEAWANALGERACHAPSMEQLCID